MGRYTWWLLWRQHPALRGADPTGSSSLPRSRPYVPPPPASSTCCRLATHALVAGNVLCIVTDLMITDEDRLDGLYWRQLYVHWWVTEVGFVCTSGRLTQTKRYRVPLWHNSTAGLSIHGFQLWLINRRRDVACHFWEITRNDIDTRFLMATFDLVTIVCRCNLSIFSRKSCKCFEEKIKCDIQRVCEVIESHHRWRHRIGRPRVFHIRVVYWSKMAIFCYRIWIIQCTPTVFGSVPRRIGILEWNFGLT